MTYSTSANYWVHASLTTLLSFFSLIVIEKTLAHKHTAASQDRLKYEAMHQLLSPRDNNAA